MGRRQFGAVRRLPSGRYQARLPDGTTAPTTFVAKADATRWLATAETDILRGTFIKRRQDDDLTVGEWLEQWHTKHSLHKRPGTLARDRSAIRTTSSQRSAAQHSRRSAHRRCSASSPG